MELYDVQVNHLQNPLGFVMERVAFSWKVRGAQGKRQTAARAVVYADAACTQIVYDTGFDAAANSLQFEIPFTPKPCTRYYYQITVRSDAGEEAISTPGWFETPKPDAPWQAKWIGCHDAEPRHPIFEKVIAPQKPVRSARLYICGLGLYEAAYNGEKIGQEYLTPYCTDYDRWVQYQTYDVTDALQKPGTLSVMLGNGWYKARFGFAAHEDKGYYGDSWKLIAELHIRYTDGEEETIGTDESWTVRRSAITFSNLYDGEHRDDTLPELPKEPARLAPPPKGRLTARRSTPVTVHEILQPVELLHTPAGELVLDMGQEITGSFRLKVRAPAGTTVHIQTGEILQNGNFYNANLRTARSEYLYTSNGTPTVLEPHFTYFGFRYVKITGIPDLQISDFTALCLYSDIPQRGQITTGDALVNKLCENIRWGLKDNFLDVPTDCPQRDERMGWTGDTQVFSATALYLQDAYAFYAKYLHDMAEEQADLGGMVPDVVPSFGVHSCACVWGDACCIIPWNLYRFYGDTDILRRQYPAMKTWVDYVTKLDGNDHGWLRHFHYGDWLALDNHEGGAEQVRGATDEGYIAAIYYAASAEILAKAAKILGNTGDAKTYAARSEKQFDFVKTEYFTRSGRCCIATQTALLLALKYKLSSDPQVILHQLDDLFQKSQYQLRTGFVGTPILCETLSENDRETLAWMLLLNEDYPGWLHEVRLGATTTWERWNSLLEDGTISGIGMNSMNHYAYGSVLEWLFRCAAGLDVTEQGAGGKRMNIHPLLNARLGHLEAVYDAPAGQYRSSWRIVDETHVTVSVTVPFGCTAVLTLPHAAAGVQAQHTLGPGNYTYTYETDTPLRWCCHAGLTLRYLRSKPEAWAALGTVLDIDNVPLQYLDFTPQQVAELFGDFVKPAQLPELETILAQYPL